MWGRARARDAEGLDPRAVRDRVVVVVLEVDVEDGWATLENAPGEKKEGAE